MPEPTSTELRRENGRYVRPAGQQRADDLESDADRFEVRSGRYIGNNGMYWLELRVDLQEFEMVSGELQYLGPTPGAVRGPGTTDATGATGALGAAAASPLSATRRPLYASFRTAAGAADPFAIEWLDADGTTMTGSVSLTPPAQPQVQGVAVTLVADGPIPGLDRFSHAQMFEIEAVWTGPAYRAVGLQIHVEDKVEFPDSATVVTNRSGARPRLISVRDCFGEAGLQVKDTRATAIPASEKGWEESDIFATLNQLMQSSDQAGLNLPAFDMHLLALSRTDRGRLMGLMFDTTDCMPRQGAAVFVDTIRDIDRERTDSKIIETAVHELGHTLNLVHTFDLDVRRSAVASFMNYDWRFRGSHSHADDDPFARADAFWDTFKYRFDDDELRFLRHAPRSQIVPGGSAFGSAKYWRAPDDGRARAPWSNLELWLTPPAAGTTFAYGQRVFLEVSLLNKGPEPVVIPRYALDIKAGDLQLRITPMGNQVGDAKPFLPMMLRCYDVGVVRPYCQRLTDEDGLPGGMLRLGPGESIHSNLNLSYGSDGFDFAEPGTYELRPYLSFPPDSHDDGFDQIVPGRPLLIRTLPPQSAREERDGDTLFRSDVGASLVLGGSTALRKAAEDLEELRARRERDSARPDPVLPALARSAGIELGRRGNHREAAQLLGRATTVQALSTFDPHTAEHTLRLAKKYRSRQRGADRDGLPPVVVVDLWVRPKSPGVGRGGRVAGFLATDGTREIPSDGPAPVKFESWHVLASAAGLPAEATQLDTNSVYAEIISAGSDGLTERIAAKRVDLLGGQEGGPAEVVLLQLSRPVPTDPVSTSSQYHVPRDAAGRTDNFFGPAGSRLAEIAATTGDQLAPLADAADQPLLDQPAAGIPETAARVHTYPGVDLGDVASLFWPACLFTGGCMPVPPPEIDQRYGDRRDTARRMRLAAENCQDRAADLTGRSNQVPAPEQARESAASKQKSAP